MAKVRIDQLLARRGLAPSRERAQALILAGRVLVNGQKVEKPGTLVAADADLRLLGSGLPYVSRGGLKLEAALRHWAIPLAGRHCLDIGASTGGFTDCMLQHGAASVTAIDTGYGQIAASLRADPRVRLMERTNARLLAPLQLEPAQPEPAQPEPAQLQSGPPVSPAPEPPRLRPPATFAAVDVAFISATLVLPAVLAAAPSVEELVVLVKPQFEAGRQAVGKGGIVRDPAAHQAAIERVRAAVAALGAGGPEWIESPITGSEGNREFLLHARLAAAGRRLH